MLLGSARKRLTLVISRSNKEQDTCETTSFRFATSVLSYRDEDFFIRPYVSRLRHSPSPREVSRRNDRRIPRGPH